MREADFDCAPYSACYDPALSDSGVWGWPELVLILLAVVLLLGFLALVLQPAAKPKPTIKDAVVDVINDLENQAILWNRTEAGVALRTARTKIVKEFNDRRIF